MHLNPITLKRIRRFKRHRRAYWSFLCLLVLYALSLISELICNGVPLAMYCNGRLYFPVLFFYPDTEFTDSGLNTRTDYKALEKNPVFTEKKSSWMLWPLIKTGPDDIATQENLADSLRINVRLDPVNQVCGISIDSAMRISRFQGIEALHGADGITWKNVSLDEFWNIPDNLKNALAARFNNEDSEPVSAVCSGKGNIPDAEISLLKFTKRSRNIKECRMTARICMDNSKAYSWMFGHDNTKPAGRRNEFLTLPDEIRQKICDGVNLCYQDGTSVENERITINGIPYGLSIEKEKLRFPFRPVKGHLLGLDDAGRDVFVRLLYALRTSLSFGLILVCCSMFVGSLAGLAQGYLGGWFDLGGQRMIEIWSALPFLYIVILMGSVYGPGFWLMIFCYALFNWIGISYYMRAEMLRLRRLPFVEAAKCLGLSPIRIVFRHVLPNAMVPIITFFPFSLVGAISSLAALDYLGFGLPPPTPSIGQLLQQAQSQRWAWWLILYPSLTLFIVMMLGVFVGEGVRDAFDPKNQGRIE